MRLRTPLHCPKFPRAGLILLLGLAGCSSVPEQTLPELPVPERYLEAQPPQQAALPWAPATRALADAAPWAVFDLPELPGLLARLDAANANLALARGRYDQAASLIRQARAALYPTLNGNAAVSRGQASAAAGAQTTDSLGLSASWELDVWGRLRGTVAANTASAEASAADLAGSRLALQAQLVQALLSLRVVAVQRQLLEATVADYRRYRALTGERVRFGIASRADLAQADSQLKSAEALAVETGVQQAQLRHALAVLVGELPSQFELPDTAARPAPLRAPLRAEVGAPPAPAAAGTPERRENRDAGRSPALKPDAGGPGDIHPPVLGLAPGLPPVPLTAPSTLLQRRPDIVAAERRAAAANAQIGVAATAYYPVLSLGVTLGQKATSWDALFSTPARVWSLGPALATTLFDAGLRRAQQAQALASWDQAAASYRQTTLAAFQEVEDQLATLRILADEARIQDEAVAAARSSAELSLAQYRAGTATSLQVITANAQLLNTERTALELHSRRLSAAVTLIRALGGGWGLVEQGEADQ
ncbi:MAG: hypothetical protein RIR00_1145 [Pseudomonadota bacterium]